jgi:hypothetical protein
MSRVMGILYEEVLHLWQYLAKFVLEWEIFQIKIVEKINKQFIFNNFVSKIMPFMK